MRENFVRADNSVVFSGSIIVESGKDHAIKPCAKAKITLTETHLNMVRESCREESPIG